MEAQSQMLELERLKEWMHRLVSDMHNSGTRAYISDIEVIIQGLSVQVSKLEEYAARNQPAESPTQGVFKKATVAFAYVKPPLSCRQVIHVTDIQY